jgi:hypothetical protein
VQSATTQQRLGMIQRHGVEAVALGNGVGCRQSEEWLAAALRSAPPRGGAGGGGAGRLGWRVVSECGASIYR